MSAPKDFYLLSPGQSILESDPASWLGKVVNDYHRPTSAYTPKAPFSPGFNAHEDPNYSNVIAVVDALSSNSVKLSLLELFSVSHEDYKTKKYEFTSRKVQRLRVHHDAKVLERVLQTKEVSSDLKKWDVNMFSTLYLVVGALVSKDIVYKENVTAGHKSGANVDPVQIGSISAGTPGLGVLQSSVSGMVEHSTKNEISTRIKGSRIFAIEYRTFRKKIVQKGDKKGELKGHGPKGDRMFNEQGSQSLGLVEEAMEIQTALDPESFFEIIDTKDGKDEYCFRLASN